MKAAALVLAALALLGWPHLAAAALADELAACGTFGALIWRAPRFRSDPYPRRTA